MTRFLQKLEIFGTQPRRAQPKPPRGAAKREKRREDRVHDQKRDACRVHVFNADHGRCRRCETKVWLRPSQAPHELRIANIHEFVPRSAGGDDTDPFNCITLCGDCHPEFTEHRLQMVASDPKRLMRGHVEFIPVEGKVA